MNIKQSGLVFFNHPVSYVYTWRLCCDRNIEDTRDAAVPVRRHPTVDESQEDVAQGRTCRSTHTGLLKRASTDSVSHCWGKYLLEEPGKARYVAKLGVSVIGDILPTIRGPEMQAWNHNPKSAA